MHNHHLQMPVELMGQSVQSLFEEQIQAVADHVTQMIMKAINRKPRSLKAPGSN